ncbi:MAG: hypothetical protein K2N91_08370, partial [Muribaculaceae bacterium]|nr:hypothetical protein [Muribaculaceae bacterium]
MKFLLTIIITILSTITPFAFETNNAFGFKRQNNPNYYQQYVGKVFTIREPQGEYETWELTGLKSSLDPTSDRSNIMNKSFTILKIEVKDVKINKIPNRKVTIHA